MMARLPVVLAMVRYAEPTSGPSSCTSELALPPSLGFRNDGAFTLTGPVHTAMRLAVCAPSAPSVPPFKLTVALFVMPPGEV